MYYIYIYVYIHICIYIHIYIYIYIYILQVRLEAFWTADVRARSLTQSWFWHDFDMIFTVCHSFQHRFPMVFPLSPWFSHLLVGKSQLFMGKSTIHQQFSISYINKTFIFPRFSHGFPMGFWFSYGFPRVFPWVSLVSPPFTLGIAGGPPRQPPLGRAEAAGGHLPCADAKLGLKLV